MSERTERSGTDDGSADADDAPRPLVRRAGEVEYEDVSAAPGLRRGVLVGEADGAPNFAVRRFTLAPGAEVPKHTNAVEHEQYVLAGEYVVGLGAGPETPRVDGDAVDGDGDGDGEYVVRPGDSLLIPAGTVHWYRNEGDEEGAFLCAVPTGDDAIDLVEDG